MNDLPEGQGHTEFPLLNLTIQPERGKALIFCNIDSQGMPDRRLLHKACPVFGENIKYGVNIWITNEKLQILALEKSTIISNNKSITNPNKKFKNK